VSPRQPLDLLYADVEPSLAEKAVSSLRPTPVRIAWDVSAHAPWSEGFDVGYVFTEEDKAVDISGQKAMFSLFPAGSFSASLISSHSPFFSVPDALADTIQDAAEFVLKRRASS
jgi:hypothetical protein